MKKILQFLRSMRFGILLLALITVCSVVGSVIPQGREVGWYAGTYRGFHGYLLMLKLNDIFHSWYFIALLVLLCLNLSLCSLVRIRSVVRGGRPSGEAAARLENTVHLTNEGVAQLTEHLRHIRCREEVFGGVRVYTKNAIGRYGTFLTHLSILLTVLFGAAALYLPTVTDQTCMPGESITMDDGTAIYVEDFQIEDESGELDYASRIRVTLPDGQQSDTRRISVNHPLSFGRYKIYQQTYGTAGSLLVRNTDNGSEDTFTLTETCFLSIDGTNGLWYEALYPGYLRDENGNFTLITSTAGRYTDPVYQVLLSVDGENTPVLAFPGETLTVNEIQFQFNDPVEYPGLRIKRTPAAANALLCGAFVLMIAGLYITFFLQPVLVKVDEDGYCVGGPKPEGMRLQLQLLLQDKERTDEEC